MRKKYIIVLMAIVTIIAGFMVGVVLANRNKTSNLEPEIESKLAKETQNMQNELDTIATSHREIKTSPNAILVLETYYQGCQHTTIKREEIPTECVNQTEENLQEKYRDWKIKEFTNGEVILYQERQGICEEHYLVKEHNGYVAIYTVDKEGKETLKETTEIVISYLPETDKLRLKEGIKVYGKENLNATIEDYE